jgi:hypothetical protein
MVISMGKKVSILSRLKSLFNNTGTSITQYQDDIKIIEKHDKREYRTNNHFYVKKLYLDNGSTMDEVVVDIEGYQFIQIVDHAGYEVDDITTYKGEVYIVYNNTVDVIARVDEFRVPGGLIASRYVGKPLAKSAKKR